MVAVFSCTGKVLMPTSEYRARKLLQKKKAVICNYQPFAIRLVNNKTEDIQPVELSMDTGYQHIGISVKSEKHEYLARVLLNNGKSIAIKKVTIIQYAGGYIPA